MEGNILKGTIAPVDNPGQSLGEIFYKTFKNTPNPNKEILVDALTQESFTVQQVFLKSMQVALKLHQFGVRKGDIVGIISENRTDYIFPVIGCFYLGATINPLNPDYVSREIQHAFEITKPKFVLVSATKLNEITEVKKQVDFIQNIITFEDFNGNDEEFEDLKEFEEKVAGGIDTFEHLAIILCSSGTTGLPKGVAITHENVKHSFLYTHKDSFGMADPATFLAMLPFYHILGFMSLVACILYGAKTIVLSKFKPIIFMQTIETYKITKLFLVPPLAVFLAKSTIAENYDLSSIKDLICGGAPLGAEIQTALEEKLGVPVRQAYGLTEICAVSVTPHMETRYPGSSGIVVANMQAKIVDLETNQPLGVNQTGELCLKAPTTMKCYYGNQQATQEAFDSDGFLRTGDIGYCNEDGFIFIVDRLKELIKYKGFQVPPAELEDILMKHEEIKDAAVIGVKDERAGELAKAYVVKSEHSQLSEEDVKDFVAKNVSVQKQLFGGVEFIQTIPKSASGKILRKELRQLVANQ